MRNATLAAITALLVLVAATGCGQTPPSVVPSALGPAAVCALVEDMDALVGRTAVAPPGGYTGGTSDRCLWTYGRDPSRYVGVTVGPSALHDETIGVLGAGEAVAGLPADARWWAAARTLSVAWGDRTLQVDVRLDEPIDPRELALGVAERIVGQAR